MKKVIVAGGGASGMAAAISAAASGAAVILLEAREQVGKKLLKTGSGRCNFTNALMTPDCYYGNRAFIHTFLKQFSTEDSLRFFGDLGLLYREREGYYYPYSNSAASVLSVLNERLKTLNVDVRLNTPVRAVRILTGGGFLVETPDEKLRADALVISAGSDAGSEIKGESDSARLLDGLMKHRRPYLPALTFLTGNEGCEKQWEGVRSRASVSFMGKTETGEIQLVKNGISGIPVFQLSRNAVIALSDKQKAVFTIDFMPDYSEETLKELLKKDRNRKTEDLLKGWIPKKLIPVILKRAGLFGDRTAGGLSDRDQRALLCSLKAFSYRVTGHGNMAQSQTVSGGVDPKQLKDDFMSLSVPGLYFTGETVDIDGICGGYNLHFAFGSGILAGKSAAGKEY